MQKIILMTVLSSLSCGVIAQGNQTNDSFNRAKKLLMKHVYSQGDARQTLYCGATFDSKKNITLPQGFVTTKYIKRSKRVEFEHVVPAENFGRIFVEWREGNSACVSRKGKAFKGRKCAEKMNTEYRYMQSDMYNLFPAIGAVNAARSNYNFAMLPNESSDFGQCDMRIDSRKAQPPRQARGEIARAYLYMEGAYSRYSMSKSQRQLMSAWDKQYPVTESECQRAKRIEVLQKNSNPVMQARCYLKRT